MKFTLATIFCVLSLLTGCTADAPDGEDESLLHADIIDGEGLFDPQTFQELASFIDSLEKQSGVDFVVATVPDPGAEGLITFAASMTRRISPGLPGINNGAIVYLSDNSREVKVECGHGMEWYASDTASGLIIESMRPFLVSRDYEKAVKRAFSEITKLSSEQDWEGDLPDWDGSDTTELEPGMILTIRGRGIARAYQEGVPEAAQFHSNYFVEIAHHNLVSKVYFSGYMKDMIDQLVYLDKPFEVYCLVLNTSPVQLGLLGTNELP